MIVASSSVTFFKKHKLWLNDAATCVPVHGHVDALIKQTNPVCLFAIVHPSAHPLYAGVPTASRNVRVCVRVCIDDTCIITLTDKRG